MQTYTWICQVCHEKGDRYCYTDEAHGMTNVQICPQCLYKHVKQYYPGCPIQLSLEDNHPELKQGA